MRILAFLSGLVAVACSYWLHIGSYLDGMAFDQSWSYPMIGIPVLLVSCLAFMGATIGICVLVYRKTLGSRNLLMLAIFPLLFIGGFYAPIPTFVDGLHDAVAEKLDRSTLLELASQARELHSAHQNNQDINDGDHILAALQLRFAAELSLSRLEPRLQISDKSVTVYYGGSLTKHWGYAIVADDTCPIDHIPSHLCRKVYDNVWVYKDIW